MAGNIYSVDVEMEALPILANAKILNVDIDFVAASGSSPGEFDPGGGGIIRLYFSFTTAGAADTVITVTKLGQVDLLGFPLKLNADQNFVIKSDGYYRFDIGVEVGDKVNLSSTIQIDKINEMKIHKIVIGA